MAENKLYYPFDYRPHLVYSVALYGNNHPYIIKGHLVLRTYYTDDSKKKIDIAHTSDAVMDTVFFETNNVIREQLGDGYNGRRELVELSIPELGKQYRIIYNAAELPSIRYDDQIGLLSYRDPSARGVAVIMKRDPEKGIQWLNEPETREIVRKLQTLSK